MSSPLSALLREWRTARQLSSACLAERAGVTRQTLSRWENGQFQPRLPELEALLVALQASPIERTRALSLLDAPRGVQKLREETQALVATGEEDRAELLPATGDLLRALRCRRGWTQEQLAAPLRVNRSAIVYWEQSKASPSEEQRETLLTLLGAYPEERAALTGGHLLLGLAAEPLPATADSLEMQLRALETQLDAGDNTLMDLRLLTLESQLAPLAQRRSSARILLAQAYRAHSRWLWWRARMRESLAYTERVLATTLPQAQNAAFASLGIDAIHIAAGVVADAGTPRAAAEAIERIRYGFGLVTGPQDSALLYRDLSDYLCRVGQNESAFWSIGQASEAAERTGDADQIALTRYNHANLLIRAGRASEALPLLRTEELPIPLRNVNEAFLWCEALLELNNCTEAANWLRRAYAIIAEHDLGHLQFRAEHLSRRLSSVRG